MKLTSYAQNLHDLSQIREAGLTEVILGPEKLSRLGKLSSEEFAKLAQTATDLGLRVILEWDVLATENDFSKTVDCFQSLELQNVGAVRVQDVGAAEYILTHTKFPIQFLAETGNHNLLGLKRWRSYFGERLERMVLSIELTKDKLQEYRVALNVPVEFLILGRILLFYTPRNLLSALSPEADDFRAKQLHSIEAIGESEESPHKGFPIIENRHGTFMFHIKNQYLIENLQELQFLDYGRVDFRYDSDIALLAEVMNILKHPAEAKAFKAKYGLDVIRGFFKVNKTDVLFKKLKNSRIQRKDDSYLGEVIEIQKGEYQVIRLKGKFPLQKGDRLQFITPEGKEFSCPVVFLKNTSMQDEDQIGGQRLAVMNYLGGVWVKSQVYKKIAQGE